MLIVGTMVNNNPKFLSFTEIIYLQMILFFERELVYCKKKKKNCMSSFRLVNKKAILRV